MTVGLTNSKSRASLAEWLCYGAGALLVAGALFQMVSSEVRAAQASAQLPEMQLWSDEAKARYVAALDETPGATLGRLRAPSLGLEVPVYENASDLHMDLGAGVIEGMSYPHEPGHIGIAGHRDGYFRALKDIAVGDALVLDTLDGEKRFVVEELKIIDPEEVAYLDYTTDQRLTIVTCYPFYYAGNAPQRFLVRAAPQSL